MISTTSIVRVRDALVRCRVLRKFATLWSTVYDVNVQFPRYSLENHKKEAG